ncbi:MAG: hypothetical protein MPW17_21685 (plasmid) [Candidatus Manganitrophus sp.]|nr:MAG: hypothetical protein MPW17_21685 [Candidatus Manganitrophus sp.]
MVLDDDIPHDAALPQLADVLNRSKMKALFQAEFFPEGRFRIEACSIERVKYKPGKNCLVCYRLEIRDRMTQQVFTQRLSTRIFEKGGRSPGSKKRNYKTVSCRFSEGGEPPSRARHGGLGLSQRP